MALVVTLLGGESTGKTSLARALCEQLAARGVASAMVAEHLRHWCEQHRRAPHLHEQAALAREQARLTDEAASRLAEGVVIADTSPLVIAAYSELYFQDRSLWSEALAWQCRVDLTLLMGLDLPWVADGFFRDSPAVRDAVDTVIRRELQTAGLAFQTIHGRGTARTEQALRAIGRRLGQDLTTTEQTLTTGRRAWSCDQCSDPDCEHRLFSKLLAPNTHGDTRP
ncbi:ATP-binding protein [Hydrogenophaga pseudoflava]|uniref:ATP-binding protein n=1 Tax=Hydrogenophaga pseudoflava TaxID=47421 RepID=UPI0027E4F53C|nr:ATP-binding protein [Hydrogenophaga pseudoflava]MDQ7745572.1 ATP-binding protein [Hydrogenophaga pseudoflava]